jgi:alkylmercury lyase
MGQEGEDVDYARAADMTRALIQSGGVLDYGAERSRLLLRVLRTLAHGQPVSEAEVDRISAELGMAPSEAHDFLRAVTERDAAERIVGVLGLSLNEHPHQFSVAGHRMSTWCAEDTLFLPALLGEQATIESTSPLSRETVRLTVGPEGVQAVSPAGAVVSIVIVDPGTGDMRSVDAIWRTFCRHIHFFASRQEAERWSAGRDDIGILTPAEGYAIGRELTSPFLAQAG